MKQTLDTIYKTIIEQNMSDKVSSIVIGLSGGADSVCLAVAVSMLAEKLELDKRDIHAVHINHMIRGGEADRDESFAGEICNKLGIGFEAFKVDIPAIAAGEGMTLEEAGRKKRYEVFAEKAAEYGAVVAVAHNKNDNAETILFNLTRGSSLKGISGIPATRQMDFGDKSIKIIRPLISVDRKEIEAFVEKAGMTYITDSTNLGSDYDRNKIRQIVLPELNKINSQASEHLCKAAKSAKMAFDYISKCCKKQYGEFERDEAGNLVLYVEKIKALDSVLQEQLIYEAIIETAGRMKDISDRHVSALMGLLEQETGKKLDLPYNITARKSYDKILLAGDNISDAYRRMSGNVTYEIFDKSNRFEISKKIYTKDADYDKIIGRLCGDICIRTPEDGDYIVINTDGSTKKLSRVFIDARIDRKERENWPVVAVGQEIIWVVGIRYSAAFNVDDDTEKIIRFTYTEQIKGENYGRENQSTD